LNRPNISVSTDFCDIAAVERSSAPSMKTGRQFECCKQATTDDGFTESEALFQENKNRYKKLICMY